MKWIFTLGFLLLLSGNLCSQINDRSTFAVFTPIEVNDTVLVAGGQVIVGHGVEQVTHGYYPLQQTLLSVPSIKLDLQVNTYPVPFINQVTIAFQNEAELLITAEITAPSGAIVYQHSTDESEVVIPTMNWESGIYIVHLITPDGTFLYSDKIIKI